MPSESLTVLRGSVRIPTSKPHTQRALLLAALAEGRSTIHNPNLCSEAALLQRAVTALGARCMTDGGQLIVEGVGGRPNRPSSVLNLAGSGFALRHLLPIAALAEAPCVLTGNRRLAGRPIQPLLTALAELGCRVEPVDRELTLPIITWDIGIAGGTVDVPASETSQFVSSLMLAAPYAAAPVTIRVPGEMVSHHYVRITYAMMRQFGADVRADDDLHRIDVKPSGYRAGTARIGPDVNAFFYFAAAAVVTDADILVEDVQLGEDSLLDSALTVARRMGVRLVQEGSAVRIVSGPPPAERILIDARGIPTLVPALAAVASSLPHGMVLRNARHIQHHKTSRLQVVLEELARMGRILRPILRDGQLDGFETYRTGAATVDEVDGRGDHRNFMALSIAAMAVEREVHVHGAETLHTSFADFKDCFRSLTSTHTRS